MCERWIAHRMITVPCIVHLLSKEATIRGTYVALQMFYFWGDAGMWFYLCKIYVMCWCIIKRGRTHFDALWEKGATIRRTYVLYKCFIFFWMQDAESEFWWIKTTWSPVNVYSLNQPHTQRRITAVQHSTGYTRTHWHTCLKLCYRLPISPFSVFSLCLLT
jgi:hypothetical protein